MSRLVVITRSELLPGFQLAGVDAHAPEDIEAVQELISDLMESDEVNLLAIDDGLLAGLDPALLRRLEACEHLPYLTIPGGQPPSPLASRRRRISEIIRRAIGFHITFKGEEAEA